MEAMDEDRKNEGISYILNENYNMVTIHIDGVLE